MKQNYLNVQFIIHLLEQIQIALKAQEPILKTIQIEKWGCHDDFIYSEILQGHFQELLPSERKALMQIVREAINSSTKAYADLLDEDYLCYENFNLNEHCMGDFIDQLGSEHNDYC